MERAQWTEARPVPESRVKVQTIALWTRLKQKKELTPVWTPLPLPLPLPQLTVSMIVLALALLASEVARPSRGHGQRHGSRLPALFFLSPPLPTLPPPSRLRRPLPRPLPRPLAQSRAPPSPSASAVVLPRSHRPVDSAKRMSVAAMPQRNSDPSPPPASPHPKQHPTPPPPPPLLCFDPHSSTPLLPLHLPPAFLGRSPRAHPQRGRAGAPFDSTLASPAREK